MAELAELRELRKEIKKLQKQQENMVRAAAIAGAASFLSGGKKGESTTPSTPIPQTTDGETGDVPMDPTREAYMTSNPGEDPGELVAARDLFEREREKFEGKSFFEKARGMDIRYAPGIRKFTERKRALKGKFGAARFLAGLPKTTYEAIQDTFGSKKETSSGADPIESGEEITESSTDTPTEGSGGGGTDPRLVSLTSQTLDKVTQLNETSYESMGIHIESLGVLREILEFEKKKEARQRKLDALSRAGDSGDIAEALEEAVSKTPYGPPLPPGGLGGDGDGGGGNSLMESAGAALGGGLVSQAKSLLTRGGSLIMSGAGAAKAGLMSSGTALAGGIGSAASSAAALGSMSAGAAAAAAPAAVAGMVVGAAAVGGAAGYGLNKLGSAVFGEDEFNEALLLGLGTSREEAEAGKEADPEFLRRQAKLREDSTDAMSVARAIYGRIYYLLKKDRLDAAVDIALADSDFVNFSDKQKVLEKMIELDKSRQESGSPSFAGKTKLEEFMDVAEPKAEAVASLDKSASAVQSATGTASPRSNTARSRQAARDKARLAATQNLANQLGMESGDLSGVSYQYTENEDGSITATASMGGQPTATASQTPTFQQVSNATATDAGFGSATGVGRKKDSARYQATINLANQLGVSTGDLSGVEYTYSENEDGTITATATRSEQSIAAAGELRQSMSSTPKFSASQSSEIDYDPTVDQGSSPTIVAPSTVNVTSTGSGPGSESSSPSQQDPSLVVANESQGL